MFVKPQLSVQQWWSCQKPHRQSEFVSEAFQKRYKVDTVLAQQPGTRIKNIQQAKCC